MHLRRSMLEQNLSRVKNFSVKMRFKPTRPAFRAENLGTSSIIRAMILSPLFPWSFDLPVPLWSTQTQHCRGAVIPKMVYEANNHQR